MAASVGKRILKADAHEERAKDIEVDGDGEE